MSRRLKITLPDALATQLDELAANAGEPVARLAAQMVRQGIAEADTSEHVPAAHDQPAPVVLDTYNGDESEQRAPWLEPYGGDREWRSWMWGGIVALHGRYPTALADLKDGWWESEAHVETLCALVVWRQLIDDTCRDPREELTFQVSLSDYGHTLRQEGGSVTRAWIPGAPPEGWVR
jgi:CopG-like RHH_1 or ribbon-helix-helix domain, RHH_5